MYQIHKQDVTDGQSQGNPRTVGILAVAKENNIDLEVVETTPAKGVSADYLKLNKLGRVPTFEGADGFVLSEMMAIAVYSESLWLDIHPTMHNDEMFHQITVYPWQKNSVENLQTLIRVSLDLFYTLSLLFRVLR